MATILIAPDKFKRSLSAHEVALSLREGILKARPSWKVIPCPLADGGEGTAEVLAKSLKGQMIEVKVKGPLMAETAASFALIEADPSQGGVKTAIVEMASASGLSLLSKERRNPLHTTTFGSGELILSALEEGAKRVIIAIGGSATNDGGMGMAQALGARFFDKDGFELGIGTGALLERVHSIDITGLSPKIEGVDFLIASDVKNPLFGPEGAAFTYAPQKGASLEEAERLDLGLRNFAKAIERELGRKVADEPGAGAAGGLGAGLIAFLGAKMRLGIDLVIEAAGLMGLIDQADLVITGEGKLDRQTLFGKVPIGILNLAKERGKPCVIVAGMIEGDIDRRLTEEGAIAVYSLLERAGGSEEESMEGAAALLEEIGQEIAKKQSTTEAV